MNGRRILTTLILLMTMAACVIPGLSTPAALPPTPTMDLVGPVQTMVAATVSAAIMQTEQFVPSPAPVSVIVVTAPATATPLSTPTATSTTVPADTPTSTPSAESQPQSTLTKQDDGSFLFEDHLAGYEIQLPPGWLTMRVNEQEYRDAFASEAASSQHIQQALLGVQNENPNILRLFAVDPQPPHIQNEFVSDMRFVLDAGKTISLNSDADLQAIAAKIPESATVFRFEVTSVELFNSISGMQFGVIETKSSFANNAGVDVPLFQKQVFFNTKGGVQSITITTLADLKDTLLPAFNTMLETIKPNQN